MDGYRRYARSGLAAGRRRVPLKAAKKFLMENTTALKSFAEYVAPGELSSLDELEHGQGCDRAAGSYEGRSRGLSVPRFDVRYRWRAD
jgi:hypothetical protein